MLHLVINIVGVGLGAELHLFEQGHDLILLCRLLFFLLLVLVFPIVEDLTDGGIRVGRDLRQVQSLTLGQLDGRTGVHDAKLAAIGADHPDFAGPDTMVNADIVARIA